MTLVRFRIFTVTHTGFVTKRPRDTILVDYFYFRCLLSSSLVMYKSEGVADSIEVKVTHNFPFNDET